jgi:transposase InsO family protein
MDQQAGHGSGAGARRYYTPEERREALEALQRSGLTRREFARHYGVSEHTLYVWGKAYAQGGPKGLERLSPGPAKPRGKAPLAGPVKAEIAAVKRGHPTFGLRKVRDFLLRFRALRVSTGSVRKVLAEEGLPSATPVRRRRRHKQGPPQRFERSRPGELWQGDITYVDVSFSRRPLYLSAFLDDHSRYVVAHVLSVHQRAEVVLEPLLEGMARYGRPKEVLTDQGRQYFAWRGKSEFQKRLRAEGIGHVVARAQHPQTLGKIERLWKTIQEELWSRVRPRDLQEARMRLEAFLAHYNFERPHQGLEGQVPADRFFGAQSEVRRAIEAGVEKNALRLAVGETPRRPVFLVGQIDGRTVSVHGEAGRVVVQLPDGERREIESKDLGLFPAAGAPKEPLALAAEEARTVPPGDGAAVGDAGQRAQPPLGAAGDGDAKGGA